MARVALLSGGKDSLYAATRYWPPDYGLLLVYDSPLPNPHLENLGKTVETLLLAGIKVVVAKLPRGREYAETVRVLKSLGTDTLVAGDVYIEDHLKYWERVAGEAGAELREPLWGMDPRELLYRIVEEGFEALVIGVRNELLPWLGRVLGRETVEAFAEYVEDKGFDPLGERGEYHTLVLESPVHASRLTPRTVEVKASENYWLLKLV